MDRTQVAIIGAGPAGLLLAHLLHRAGIETVVLEAKSREYLETSPHRIRAGVLEWGTKEILVGAGLGERLLREGFEHRGIYIAFEGKLHRVDFPELADGWRIWVYGQQYEVRDMIATHLRAGGEILFEAEAVGLEDVEERPEVVYRLPDGRLRRLAAEFVVGADGSHSTARASIRGVQIHERVYPFGWLGILAETEPAAEELIYVSHPRGFALFSMRSPTLARNYLQVQPDEDPAAWPEDRIWTELERRLDGLRPLKPGRLLEKSITPHRSLVVEPMQYGRLFLVGDAAHVVPPTGAKGMNLAVADVMVLCQGLLQYYRERDETGLAQYTDRCLRHVWQGEFFSYWMTTLLHRSSNPFEERLRVAYLRHVLESPHLLRFLAENYVGRHTSGRYVEYARKDTAV
ncbi:MAG: 4-hydroxybenzoate 3-monooxygenase [Armatimonadota bacterium]|nr:4-hydroxybenzoate 3-monooxygenase [Armatimonadota bacterium]MDR7439351.1 4-hydroxybenzoate 3-monooxygenase [Armatimonadota bacterium]MDR7563190.1 4-hydroxybenzoate 3-monooxygenase [Armatimonadota bacterium]MDR7567395.1 4-hydroxybenzoate 3-monooxygenase [Armatimonadota bacterium]MDR7602834.1 4-hydroxybenzoate 3-monooxygenase [Armatimonadota bacterium]